MTSFQVWLYLVGIPGMGKLSGWLLILFFIIGMSIFWILIDDDENIDNGKLIKVGIITSILCVVFGIIFFITPSSKQMAAIYLIPKIVNNNNINQIPDNIAKDFNKKALDYINDLTSSGDNKP